MAEALVASYGIIRPAAPASLETSDHANELHRGQRVENVTSPDEKASEIRRPSPEHVQRGFTTSFAPAPPDAHQMKKQCSFNNHRFKV